MIRNTQHTDFQPIIIDLDGEQGNVFYLMSIAKQFSRRHGFKDITEEMMSSDYEHAVLAFEELLGDYVILETKNDNLLNELLERKRFREKPVQETQVYIPVFNF